jgi:hypothetical protein
LVSPICEFWLRLWVIFELASLRFRNVYPATQWLESWITAPLKLVSEIEIAFAGECVVPV